MTTIELRNKLLNYISTADASVLQRIEGVIQTHESLSSSPVLDLPDVAQKLIQQSKEDVDQGRVRSHAEVMADIKEKYNISTAR